MIETIFEPLLQFRKNKIWKEECCEDHVFAFYDDNHVQHYAYIQSLKGLTATNGVGLIILKDTRSFIQHRKYAMDLRELGFSDAFYEVDRSTIAVRFYSASDFPKEFSDQSAAFKKYCKEKQFRLTGPNTCVAITSCERMCQDMPILDEDIPVLKAGLEAVNAMYNDFGILGDLIFTKRLDYEFRKTEPLLPVIRLPLPPNIMRMEEIPMPDESQLSYTPVPVNDEFTHMRIKRLPSKDMWELYINLNRLNNSEVSSAAESELNVSHLCYNPVLAIKAVYNDAHLTITKELSSLDDVDSIQSFFNQVMIDHNQRPQKFFVPDEAFYRMLLDYCSDLDIILLSLRVTEKTGTGDPEANNFDACDTSDGSVDLESSCDPDDSDDDTSNFPGFTFGDQESEYDFDLDEDNIDLDLSNEMFGEDVTPGMMQMMKRLMTDIDRMMLFASLFETPQVVSNSVIKDFKRLRMPKSKLLRTKDPEIEEMCDICETVVDDLKQSHIIDDRLMINVLTLILTGELDLDDEGYKAVVKYWKRNGRKIIKENNPM